MVRLKSILLPALFLFISSNQFVRAVDPYGPADAQWTIVVMDPMAGPLACECVKGYAQRKYEVLADTLTSHLKQTFRVVWTESLAGVIEKDSKRRADFVFGKDSVIRDAAKKLKLEMAPIVQLTDLQGSVMQHGLFVVRKESPAATVLDLENYQVLWGPADCDEKSSAARSALEDSEISVMDGAECSSCSVAVKQLMQFDDKTNAVAVISSYAAPLLEGCGTVKKGDLKVVGSTAKVPFVSGFVSESVPPDIRRAVTDALLSFKSDEFLAAMETQKGFVAYEDASPKKR